MHTSNFLSQNNNLSSNLKYGHVPFFKSEPLLARAGLPRKDDYFWSGFSKSVETGEDPVKKFINHGSDSLNLPVKSDIQPDESVWQNIKQFFGKLLGQGDKKPVEAPTPHNTIIQPHHTAPHHPHHHHHHHAFVGHDHTTLASAKLDLSDAAHHTIISGQHHWWEGLVHNLATIKPHLIDILAKLPIPGIHH